MALQLGALREALIEAGASKDKADKAAEELAGYEHRLAGLETKVSVLMAMVAGLYAIGVPALWLLLRIAAKVGALQ
jgi:hypothetical protein